MNGSEYVNMSNITLPEMPYYISVTSTVFYSIIFIIGIIGNGLVITVVAINKDMRNSTNTFLVNLSVADLLVILICMPPGLAEIYAKDQWYFGGFMFYDDCRIYFFHPSEGTCSVWTAALMNSKLVPFLESTASKASVISMLVIGIERFQAICFPLKLRNNKLFTKTTKLLTILGLWLFSMLCSVPFLFIAVYRGSRYLDGTPIKVCRMNMEEPWKKYYLVATFLMFFVIPFLVLMVLYVLVGRTIAMEQHIFGDKSNGRNHTRVNTRRQVALMVSIVTILFFICYLPYRVFGLWVMYTTSASLRKLGFENYWIITCFARIMLYLNSCINPIIYNMVSTKFRRAFNSYLFRKRPSYYYSEAGTLNYNPSASTIMLKKRVSYH